MSEEPIPVETSDAAPERKPFLPVPILVGVVFVLLVLAGLFWISRRPKAAPPPVPSAESLAYLPQIGLSDFQMSAADNMLGANLIYLDGKVANNGSKAVRHLRVRLYFYDSMSQVVLKEEQDIVRPNAAPLGAGETRDFQLRFERLPTSWNFQPPQFQLVALQIE